MGRFHLLATPQIVIPVMLVGGGWLQTLLLKRFDLPFIRSVLQNIFYGTPPIPTNYFKELIQQIEGNMSY